MTKEQRKILMAHHGEQVLVMSDFTGRAVGARGRLHPFSPNGKGLAGFAVLQFKMMVAYINLADIITTRKAQPDIHDGDTLHILILRTFQKPRKETWLRRYVG